MASKAKQAQSSFNLWKRTIPRLRRTFKTLDEVRAKLPEEDLAAQLALIDYDLKANREVRETLQTEIRVRREVAELRKLEYDGMDESMIEAELIRTATRRGYRRIEDIRKHAVEYLMKRGASADAAHLLVDEVIPPVKVERKRKPLESYIRAKLNELDDDLTEGIRDVESLLTSERASPQDVGASTVKERESSSDESEGPRSESGDT